MKKYYLICGIILLLIFITNPILQAQDSIACRVVKAYPNGSYLVQIGDKTFLAITEEIEKNVLKMKRDLLDAQTEITLKDSLLANYNKTTAWYETTISKMKEYISELETVSDGYKKLVQDYKQLKEPWFTFNGGIGATGDKKKPAILMGIGIRKVSVWGFLQERNSGALICTRFKLF